MPFMCYNQKNEQRRKYYGQTAKQKNYRYNNSFLLCYVSSYADIVICDGGSSDG